MTSKKKNTTHVAPKPNAPQPLAFEVTGPAPRKRRLSSTVFKPGNKHRIRPSQVLNPNGSGGKKKNENLLVSKSLKVQLNNRAPDRVCEALGLKHHSSWAQCLAQRLLRVAVSGEMHSGGAGMAALEMLVRLTEPGGGKASPGELAQAAAALNGPARVDLVFLESDGNGNLRPGDAAAFNAEFPRTIDAERPAPPMLDSTSEGD